MECTTRSRTLCPDCGQPRRNGDWPFCDDGSGKHGHVRPHGGTLLQSIHPLERAVIYRNPETGDIKTPMRNDLDMPEAYKTAGYVREEVDTHQKRRELEKEGKFMEAAYYDNGSATAEREMEAKLGPPLPDYMDDSKEPLSLQDLKDAGLQD